MDSVDVASVARVLKAVVLLKVTASTDAKVLKAARLHSADTAATKVTAISVGTKVTRVTKAMITSVDTKVTKVTKATVISVDTKDARLLSVAAREALLSVDLKVVAAVGFLSDPCR